ncbi:MAG TPA: hypothetical protein VHE78_02520 [Gemmatimonadaceae bacterium]|nr:hypothetical protein [Gemmatimonadaceae bacterium]
MVATLFASAASTGAQTPAPCIVDTLTTGFPPQWLGTRVGQITIHARNVVEGGGTARALVRALHWPTQLRITSNELSFAPGGFVDSLEVLESVRRLRRTQLFTEVLLEGRRCGETTDFDVWTRDAWSLRVDGRANGGDSRLSLSEVNLFGSARGLTLQVEDVNARRSFNLGLVDPYLFNSRFRASALLRSYTDGRSWNWNLRTRERSPRDPWRIVVLGQQARRFVMDSAARRVTDVTRRSEVLTVAKLVRLEPGAAWAFIGGVEHERSDIAVLRIRATLGKSEVRRQFIAPLIGFNRRSMRFGSIDWLVPGQPRAELPLGLEGEVVVGSGVEANSRTDITHLDAWFGTTTMLTSSTVLTGDLWASGYWNRDSVSNGNLRLAGALYDRAWRGIWLLRGSFERLYNPDPDVFALTTVDPFLRTLAPNSRLAEIASSVTLERSFHMYSSEGRWALDGALFGTYFDRHRLINSKAQTSTNLHATILGFGLRRILNQPTQAPVRFDIARALYNSKTTPDRWFVVLSTAAWLSNDRTRAGARENAR